MQQGGPITSYADYKREMGARAAQNVPRAPNGVPPNQWQPVHGSHVQAQRMQPQPGGTYPLQSMHSFSSVPGVGHSLPAYSHVHPQPTMAQKQGVASTAATRSGTQGDGAVFPANQPVGAGMAVASTAGSQTPVGQWRARATQLAASLSHRAGACLGSTASEMGFSYQDFMNSMDQACNARIKASMRDQQFFQMNWDHERVPVLDLSNRLEQAIHARDASMRGTVPPIQQTGQTLGGMSAGSISAPSAGLVTSHPPPSAHWFHSQQAAAGGGGHAPQVGLAPAVAPTLPRHGAPVQFSAAASAAVGRSSSGTGGGLQLHGAPLASTRGPSSHGHGVGTGIPPLGSGIGSASSSFSFPSFLSLDPSQDLDKDSDHVRDQPVLVATYGGGLIKKEQGNTKKQKQSRKRKRQQLTNSITTIPPENPRSSGSPHAPNLDTYGTTGGTGTKASAAGQSTKKRRGSERARRFEGGTEAGAVSQPCIDDITALMAQGVGLSQRGGSNKSGASQDLDTGEGDASVVGRSMVVLKPYFRLTGAVDASKVRPLPVLREALAVTLSAYATGRRNYVWAWSQLKSIRQDCVVQRLDSTDTRTEGQSSEALLFVVRTYEAHARVAAEQGDITEFNQCQTQLLRLYQRIRESKEIHGSGSQGSKLSQPDKHRASISSELSAWVCIDPEQGEQQAQVQASSSIAIMLQRFSMPSQEKGLSLPSPTADRLLTLLQVENPLAFEAEFVALRILYAVYAAVAAMSSSRTSRTMRADATDQSASAGARATLLPILRELPVDVLSAPVVQSALQAHGHAATGDFVGVFRAVSSQPGLGGRILMLAAHAHRVRAIAAVCTSLRPGMPVQDLGSVLGYRTAVHASTIGVEVEAIDQGSLLSHSRPDIRARAHCCLPVSVDFPRASAMEFVELLQYSGASIIHNGKGNGASGGFCLTVRSLAAEERARHASDIKEGMSNDGGGGSGGHASTSSVSVTGSSAIDRPLGSVSATSPVAGTGGVAKQKGKQKLKKGKQKQKGARLEAKSKPAVHPAMSQHDHAEHHLGMPAKGRVGSVDIVTVLDGKGSCTRALLSRGMDWTNPPLSAESTAPLRSDLPKDWTLTGWRLREDDHHGGESTAARLSKTSIGRALQMAGASEEASLRAAAGQWAVPGTGLEDRAGAIPTSRTFAPQERCRVLLCSTVSQPAQDDEQELDDKLLLHAAVVSQESAVDIHGPSPIAMDMNGQYCPLLPWT